MSRQLNKVSLGEKEAQEGESKSSSSVPSTTAPPSPSKSPTGDMEVGEATDPLEGSEKLPPSGSPGTTGKSPPPKSSGKKNESVGASSGESTVVHGSNLVTNRSSGKMPSNLDLSKLKFNKPNKPVTKAKFCPRSTISGPGGKKYIKK